MQLKCAQKKSTNSMHWIFYHSTAYFVKQTEFTSWFQRFCRSL